MVDPRKNEDGAANGRTWREKAYLAAGVTVVVLIGYAVLIVAMWDKVGEEDVAWSRRVLLLTGVEAIAFAAVGWLFGKEVNRGQAEAATGAQKTATDLARKEGIEASKGRALADAVREAAQRPEITGLAGGQAGPAKSHVDYLVGVANRLYPQA